MRNHRRRSDVSRKKIRGQNERLRVNMFTQHVLITIISLFTSEIYFPEPTPCRYDPGRLRFETWDEWPEQCRTAGVLLRNNIISVTYCTVATGFVSIRCCTGFFLPVFCFNMLLCSDNERRIVFTRFMTLRTRHYCTRNPPRRPIDIAAKYIPACPPFGRFVINTEPELL